jgi:DNA-binding MarR family transcriptional regulator
MPQTRWLDADEQAMWRAFFDMRRHLDRALENQLAEFQLSHADYTVLVVLSETDSHGMRVRDLGSRISWESSRLAHHLRRMEQRGLVTRGEHASDRRGTMVLITSAGMAAIRDAAPGHVEAVRRYFVDLLSPAEIEMLTSVCLRVSRAVGDAAP